MGWTERQLLEENSVLFLETLVEEKTDQVRRQVNSKR